MMHDFVGKTGISRMPVKKPSVIHLVGIDSRHVMILSSYGSRRIEIVYNQLALHLENVVSLEINTDKIFPITR